MNRIVEYRKARGLSQAELAERWHLTQSTLSKLESGRQGLSSQEAIRLAGISKLPIEVFLIKFKKAAQK